MHRHRACSSRRRGFCLSGIQPNLLLGHLREQAVSHDLPKFVSSLIIRHESWKCNVYAWNYEWAKLTKCIKKDKTSQRKWYILWYWQGYRSSFLFQEQFWQQESTSRVYLFRFNPFWRWNPCSLYLPLENRGHVQAAKNVYCISQLIKRSPFSYCLSHSDIQNILTYPNRIYNNIIRNF